MFLTRSAEMCAMPASAARCLEIFANVNWSVVDKRWQAARQ
jgi:hypothetical protein